MQMAWSLVDELLSCDDTVQVRYPAYVRVAYELLLVAWWGKASRQVKTKHIVITGMRVTDRLAHDSNSYNTVIRYEW